MIELPIKTAAGLNAREHWRVRAQRMKRERYAGAMGFRSMFRPGEILQLPAIVTLTRLSPGVLDSDNLQGALKAVRDGVADAFGMADNDPRIEWRYAQEKCKRGDFAVRIEVEAV